MRKRALNEWQKDTIKETALRYGLSKEDGMAYIKAIWSWVGERIENEPFKPNMSEYNFSRLIRRDFKVGGLSLRCVYDWYKFIEDNKGKKIDNNKFWEIYLKNHERHEVLHKGEIKKETLNPLRAQKWKAGQLYDSVDDADWYHKEN